MAKQGKEKNGKNKTKHNRLLHQKKIKKQKEQVANKQRLKVIINKAKEQDKND